MGNMHIITWKVSTSLMVGESKTQRKVLSLLWTRKLGQASLCLRARRSFKVSAEAGRLPVSLSVVCETWELHLLASSESCSNETRTIGLGSEQRGGGRWHTQVPSCWAGCPPAQCVLPFASLPSCLR